MFINEEKFKKDVFLKSPSEMSLPFQRTGFTSANFSDEKFDQKSITAKPSRMRLHVFLKRAG